MFVETNMESLLSNHMKRPQRSDAFCVIKNEEWRKLNKAKVVKKKYRLQHSMTFKDFTGKERKYPLQLGKMLTHKYHTILLGKKNKSDRRETYERSQDRRVIKSERGSAEKFSITANKQM